MSLAWCKPGGPWVGFFASTGENTHELQHISHFPVLDCLKHVSALHLNASSTGVVQC